MYDPPDEPTTGPPYEPPHGPGTPSHEPPHGPASGPLRRDIPVFRIGAIVAMLLALMIGAAGLYLWSQRPRLSEQQVRDVVYSTIQREAAQSFLITGYIEVTAVTRVANTRTLLPGIVGFDLGTTSATVRMPGRVSYGFDVRTLQPDMIRVLDGNVIEVDVPDPVVYGVEPNLEQMETETRRGWARLSAETAEQVRSRAIELVQGTMSAQAEQHLRSSTQPRINTADALYDMLRPVLIAAGIDDPQIRFRIGRSIVVEPNRRRE
jgi:hypothetical protein